MTEAKQDHVPAMEQITLLTHRANVQNCSRCRPGQTRAPKRSIDCKRAPYRFRRDQRSGLSPLVATGWGKGVEIPATHGSPQMNPLALFSSADGLSPNSQASLTEHKRARPEASGTISTASTELSSSVPASLGISPSPVLVFEHNRIVRDRTKEFTCNLSLLNEERLQQLFSREFHYHPNNAFLYYVNPETEDKVDASLRNEAVHNLRFMHNAFFNLSSETFCKAVNLIDRFIVKVKESELPPPETLVQITRCGGNAADLLRMEEILASKLAHDLDGVNAFDFLRTFADCLEVVREDHSNCIPSELGIHQSKTASEGRMLCDQRVLVHPNHGSGNSRIQLTQLTKRLMARLEISMCSLEVYRFRPTCLALGILAQTGVKGLPSLTDLCGVDWDDVLQCASLVDELYDIYYRDSSSGRRPTVWSLTRRSLCRIGYSSPTPLDTITEDCEPADEDEWLLPLLFEP
ncbi:unnamed protein product [Dicrocoelium dendriticum]|nr:unnamed protein product [Dicrocoelium dendriticum]